MASTWFFGDEWAMHRSKFDTVAHLFWTLVAVALRRNSFKGYITMPIPFDPTWVCLLMLHLSVGIHA